VSLDKLEALNKRAKTDTNSHNVKTYTSMRQGYNLRKSVGISRDDDFVYDKPVCLKV
jgi:hypothetical protein